MALALGDGVEIVGKAKAGVTLANAQGSLRVNVIMGAVPVGALSLARFLVLCVESGQLGLVDLVVEVGAVRGD